MSGHEECTNLAAGVFGSEYPVFDVCTQIIIAVAENTASSLAGVLRPTVLASRGTSKAVNRLLGPGFASFWLASPQCGCGWYSAPGTRPSRETETERLWKKYEAKGWSFEKAQRAIEASVKSQQQHWERKAALCDFLCEQGRTMAADVADAAGLAYLLIYEPGNGSRIPPCVLGEQVPSSRIRDGTHEMPQCVLTPILKTPRPTAGPR